MINLMLIYHVQGVSTETNVRSCQVDKYDCNLVAEKMSYVWFFSYNVLYNTKKITIHKYISLSFKTI